MTLPNDHTILKLAIDKMRSSSLPTVPNCDNDTYTVSSLLELACIGDHEKMVSELISIQRPDPKVMAECLWKSAETPWLSPNDAYVH